MPPIEAAFQRLWPGAHRASLLDDALPIDLQRAGSLTPAISGRIGRLADYAVDAGADAILYTCSAFGDAIDAVAARMALPVLKPNQAMFEAALDQGLRVGMLATFQPAVASMEKEFKALAGRRNVAATLETICVPEALAAANGGNIAQHNRLVAEAARQLAHCEAIMLAHFSTSTARELAEQSLGRTVLTAPDAAVERLKHQVTQAR